MLRVALFVAACCGLVGCCDAWAQARSLAGDGAIDCGFVDLRGDKGPSFDCAESALAGGHAFVVGWEDVGRDTSVGRYVAMQADGTIWALGRNSDGSESRLVGARCVGPLERRDLGGPVGEQLSCPQAPELVVFCE